ncbi:hypothetical protein A9Q81_13750 [Gammaproteobacteria bacterium 42_54_T18]|nr:hypothetical protein A9Q81_13750 [Gammaproteobacteria bacterium 42_54_T18]
MNITVFIFLKTLYIDIRIKVNATNPFFPIKESTIFWQKKTAPSPKPKADKYQQVTFLRFHDSIVSTSF